MILEAVWFKDGKEVYKVSPVVNIVCYEKMDDISEIEVEDGYKWHEYKNFNGEADDFVIRINRRGENND